VRLVAKGFLKELYAMEFHSFALITHNKWNIFHLDVKTTFHKPMGKKKCS
jgi:hypothetical protein